MIEALMFFIQGTFEITGLITLSLAVARAKINWKSALIVGFLLAIISYSLRKLSFFFGLHTFLILFLIMLYLNKKGQIPIVKSFLITFISTIILGLLEFTTNTVFFMLTEMPPKNAISNQVFWAVLGMPQAIIMILLAVLTSRVLKPK